MTGAGSRRARAAGLSVLAAAVLGLLAFCPGRPPSLDAPPSPEEAPESAGRADPGAPAVAPPPSAAAPASEGDAPPDPAAPWRVRVLGPAGRPLPGVSVHAVPPGPPASVTTASDGRAELTRGDGAASLEVRLGGAAPDSRHTLTDPETTLRLEDLVGLLVEVVDAVDGRRLSGAEVAVVRPVDLRIPAARDGDRFLLPVAPFRRGGEAAIALSLDLPAGYVSEHGAVRTLTATVSRFADRVSVTLPARPEARVRVRVTEADGRPVAGAEVSGVSMLGRSLPVRAGTTDGMGETTVHGLPWFRGEPFTITVKEGGRHAFGKGRLGAAAEEAVVAAAMPPEWAFRLNLKSIGIGGGGRGGAFSGRAGTIVHLAGTASPKGRLDLRILRRDGSPAAGALVVLRTPRGGTLRGRADGEGAVSFEALPPGTAKVSVAEPGFLMEAAREIAIGPGERVRAEIAESAGRRLLVRVLFADGLPVPFAEIGVAPTGGVPWVHLADGVQRVPVLTDADGRAVLPGVASGPVEITAAYGSRTARAKAGVDDALTLTLPE